VSMGVGSTWLKVEAAADKCVPDGSHIATMLKMHAIKKWVPLTGTLRTNTHHGSTHTDANSGCTAAHDVVVVLLLLCPVGSR
jgi:hypothetical protein